VHTALLNVGEVRSSEVLKKTGLGSQPRGAYMPREGSDVPRAGSEAGVVAHA